MSQRGYGNDSEYLCELIRKDRDRQRLRDHLLTGAKSAQTTPSDKFYFDGLHRRVKSAM